ncbi:MAG: TRAM domain-containing protein [Nanoarchaeota archaeon]
MDEQPPVKVGEIYDVNITAVGGKGDGIAKVKGFVLFVPNAKKGDYVKVRVTRVLAKVGFAEVVSGSEKPVREPKFATVRKEELEKEDEQPQEEYEDTEDFGEN